MAGKKWKALADYLGPRDEVALEPAKMDFTSRPNKGDCRACLFATQWSSVCREARDLAKKAGLQDCYQDVVYVPRVRDERQLQIGE
jgi:hypothetical protein